MEVCHFSSELSAYEAYGRPQALDGKRELFTFPITGLSLRPVNLLATSAHSPLFKNRSDLDSPQPDFTIDIF